MVSKRLIAPASRVISMLMALTAQCLPDATPRDPTTLLLAGAALAPRGQCTLAGVSGSIASSGILSCVSLNNYQCGATLTFQTASQRNTLTAEITNLGTAFPACATPVANALTEINALTLPGSLLLNRAGGNTGPHVSSNYLASSVSTCDATGLNTAAFLAGASRLANQSEMDFLSTARGLVAIKDAAGTCRSQMGLQATDNAIAQSIVSNSVARFAVCDYGADDATRTDCPLSLQRTELQFSGITGW